MTETKRSQTKLKYIYYYNRRVTQWTEKVTLEKEKDIKISGMQTTKDRQLNLINARHITSKFQVIPYTFFATYNNKGGFKIQFSLCSIKFH